MIRSRCDTHVHIVGPIERYPQVSIFTVLPLRGRLASSIVRFVLWQMRRAPLGWHVEIVATRIPDNCPSRGICIDIAAWRDQMFWYYRWIALHFLSS